MFKIILVLGIACASLTLKVNHEGIPGGWSDSEAVPEIDKYIR